MQTLHWVPRWGATLSFLRLAVNGTDVPAWVHSFVQNTNDLDDLGLDGAIVDDVHGLSDGARAILTEMSQVEAPDTGEEILPIARYGTLWIIRDLSHSGHQQPGVPPPGVIAPALATRHEDLFEIGVRRAGEPKSRHGVSGRAEMAERRDASHALRGPAR